jgi:hypothetical protein
MIIKGSRLSDLKEKQSKHSQGYCISIVVVLILSFILEIYWLHLGYYDVMSLLMISVLVIITILMLLDREALKINYPDRKIFTGFSILIVPLYLFLRSRFVGEKQYFLISWLLIMIVGTSITYKVDEAYENLPSCVDRYVIGELSDLVAWNGDKFVKLKDVQEISADSDKRIRICQGSISMADMSVKPVKYKIHWLEILNEWKIEFVTEE